MSSSIVIVNPGEKLAPAASFSAGPGTVVRDGFIFATLCGVRQVVAAGPSGGKPRVDVAKTATDSASSATAVVPAVGSIVLARVTRITAQQASCDILVVDGQSLSGEPFHGVIRKENVRDKEIDKVLMEECFLPGDVVRAEILSLGTGAAYVLSTSGLDFGVVFARASSAGIAVAADGQDADGSGSDLLVPVSFDLMEVPGAGIKEKRKVARPQAMLFKS